MKNKIILGDFNCTMDKLDKDGGNKTQRLYRFRSINALSKLIVGNGFEDVWRRENLDSCEFTHNDKSSGTRSRIDMVYTDITFANNTEINHITVSVTDHYNDISFDRLLSETNKLALVLLEVYDSWGKLGTMGIISRR